LEDHPIRVAAGGFKEMQMQNPYATAERLMYQDNLVTVTTTRAVIGGTTYAMANITSVRPFVEPAQIGCAVALAVGCALVGVLMGANGVGFGWFLVLLACAAAGWAYSNRRAKHWIRIGTAGAETNAMWSYDAQWTARVVGAMTEAIVARG
jgi:hypothetical protein